MTHPRVVKRCAAAESTYRSEVRAQMEHYHILRTVHHSAVGMDYAVRSSLVLLTRVAHCDPQCRDVFRQPRRGRSYPQADQGIVASIDRAAAVVCETAANQIRTDRGQQFYAFAQEPRCARRRFTSCGRHQSSAPRIPGGIQTAPSFDDAPYPSSRSVILRVERQYIVNCSLARRTAKALW